MFAAHQIRRQRHPLDRSRGTRRRGPAMALLLALLPIAAPQSRETPAAAFPDPPQVLFKDLFSAVQTAAIYQDGKAFADAVPNATPDVILAEYKASRPDSPEALKRFTDAHF